jgi:hypothetical protein
MVPLQRGEDPEVIVIKSPYKIRVISLWVRIPFSSGNMSISEDYLTGLIVQSATLPYLRIFTPL